MSESHTDIADASKPAAQPVGSVGSDVDASRARKRWGLVVVLILAAAAVVTVFAGLARNTGFFGLVRKALVASGPNIDLLATQGDATLMIERSTSARRIVVKQIGKASWLLVSQDDITADRPAINAAGDRVAYVSTRDDGQIVAVSLNKDERISITSADVARAGKDASLAISHICPWSPVDWSSTGTRLAFFGCAPDNSVSFLIISDLTPTPAKTTVIASSQQLGPDERQVKWLDANRLIVSLSTADPQQAAIMTEYSVP